MALEVSSDVVVSTTVTTVSSSVTSVSTSVTSVSASVVAYSVALSSTTSVDTSVISSSNSLDDSEEVSLYASSVDESRSVVLLEINLVSKTAMGVSVVVVVTDSEILAVELYATSSTVGSVDYSVTIYS